MLLNLPLMRRHFVLSALLLRGRIVQAFVVLGADVLGIVITISLEFGRLSILILVALV